MVDEGKRFFLRHASGEVVEAGTEDLAALVRPLVDKLRPESVYVITIQGPKVKRTVTGRFVSADLTEVILLDEKGKFKRVPIDRIIRINYYEEGREPF